MATSSVTNGFAAALGLKSPSKRSRVQSRRSQVRVHFFSPIEHRSNERRPAIFFFIIPPESATVETNAVARGFPPRGARALIPRPSRSPSGRTITHVSSNTLTFSYQFPITESSDARRSHLRPRPRRQRSAVARWAQERPRRQGGSALLPTPALPGRPLTARGVRHEHLRHSRHGCIHQPPTRIHPGRRRQHIQPSRQSGRRGEQRRVLE